MSGNLGSIYYEVDARTGKLLAAQQQADEAFDRIERGARKADSGVKKLNTQMTKTSAAVKSNLSPAIRNASYQIADLATQLQMGGNALQAFAVQGAQLLAGFGTMGAVAGAVLAIAGAMGGSLAQGADSAAGSVEYLDKAITKLNEVIAVNEQGVTVMTDSYANLSKVNAEVAKQMRNMAEIQAIAALRDLKEQAGQAQGEMSSFWRGLQGGKADAQAAAQALDDLGITTNDYKEAIAILNANQPTTQAQMATLAKSVMYIGEEYNLTNQQAYEFIRALNKAATTRTPEAMQELSGFMQVLLQDTENGNEAFRELAIKFVDAQTKGAMLEDQLNRLKGAISDAATEARNANFTTMLNTVAARLATIEQGWEAGVRMQMKAQGYTEEQIDEYVNMETAYRDAKAALDEKNKADREAIALSKRQAAEAARKAKQEEAEAQRKAKQLAAQKEQAGRFTQQVMTEYQTTVDPATGQALNPAAQVEMQEQQKKAALDKYRQLGVLGEQQYQNTLTAIQKTASMRRQQIIKDEADTLFNNQQQLIGSFGDFFGELAGVISDGAGEQNAAYRALFAVQKGFVLASAALSLQKALAEANALPFPANLPAYAQAMSAGTQILSAIRGIAFGGGRYNGGAVDSGKFYRVGESNKPELFQSGGRQYMIPGEGGRIIPNRDIGGGGGGGITLNVTNNITASNGWTEQDSKALQQTIENTAMRLMQRESTRPGGMLQGRRR
ncbi:hypothetical protein D1171_08245 [Escherichia coli]|uniref:hypothetical protein n=1 Tax=Escherichia coli TaxID=562 RepID=UPI00122F9E87|nr:hypothetical protein [Escherichia coli]KAA3540920.1 hypothetical protein D1169_00790 [Escherichia coli]KAA3542954.1 hypothetical protein D1170_06870 [Escherichia coli]KAA3552609.1 hypothetical protein D1167_06550 [Escherichia coli]KAA3559774.1 hypothetical protein D1179_00790 [Escherichia coli]KAA3561615.1 hypothetical protein D1168_06215 [Escherichia coli]